MHLFTRSAPALLDVGALFAASVAAQPPAFTTLSPPSFASGWRPAPAPSARLAVPSASLQIYDHGDPSLWEQLMLELISSARADPTGEAARFGFDLNEGLAPGTIAATPKPPLASHPMLTDAARARSQWMLDTDVFDHVGVDGSSPGDRMSAAGYVFSGRCPPGLATR